VETFVKNGDICVCINYTLWSIFAKGVGLWERW